MNTILKGLKKSLCRLGSTARSSFIDDDDDDHDDESIEHTFVQQGAKALGTIGVNERKHCQAKLNYILGPTAFCIIWQHD